MEYTLNHYIYFFIVYAFVGWIIEELFAIIKQGRFVNRGFISGPVCPKYGLCMILIINDLKDLSSRPMLQFMICIVIVAVFEYVTGVVLKLVTGKRFWDYSDEKWNLNGYICAGMTLIWASLAILTLWFLHPFLYMLYEIIPFKIMKVIQIIALCVFLLDMVVTLASSLKWKLQHSLYENISQKIGTTKNKLGVLIFMLVQKRMYRAFPEFIDQEKSEGDGFGKPDKRIFAYGLCFDKLIWIFFISALFGDWIETIFVWCTTGVLMSRSSLIYGTFSIVWGLGGALATGLLYSFRNKNDRYIFIAGTVMGGVYEYSCSVFTEVVFGTTFWDYSHLPFNINGRINLLFCFFWGFAAIIWLKVLYPAASKLIGKIHPVAGKIITTLIVVLMVLDIGISGLAIIRYVHRGNGSESSSTIGTFLDTTYSDRLIEDVYPNMKIK